MPNVTRPLRPGDQVFLVDAPSFVFRAYFQSMNQDRKFNVRPSDGLPTGAIRLFSTKLLQFIRDGAAGVKPTHLAIIFDKTEQSFRKDLYADYKAHRPDPPSDLVPQFRLAREAVKAFGLTPIEEEGLEADDLIATYACRAAEAGAEVLIVSSDKDLMQVVRPGVTFYDPESGIKGKPGYRPERRLDRDGVIDKFGVPPEQVTDVQALVGDPIDNVPGVPGIGIKTAAQLIQEYGSLEKLLDRAAEIKQPKRREALIENAERARVSKELVTLRCDADLKLPPEDLLLDGLDAPRLVAFFKALELNQLTKRVAEAYEVDAGQVEPDSVLAERWDGAPNHTPFAVPGRSGTEAKAAEGDVETSSPSLASESPVATRSREPDTSSPILLPDTLVAQRFAAAKAQPCDRSGYQTVTTLAQLDQWIGAAQESGVVAVATQTTSVDAMGCELIGVALALEPGMACYIPLRHRSGESLFENGLLPDQVDFAEAIGRLKPLLEDPGVLKVGHNFKFAWLMLAREGIEVAPYDDTMLISYVLDAGRIGAAGHGADALAEKFLGHACLTFKEVAGSGKSGITFDLVPLDRATEYAAEAADVTLRLWRVLKPRLVAERKLTVYETLERPLVAALARMERRGIAIDRQMLSRMSGDFAQSLARIEDEIYEMAGERFTIGSPKQLADILFGKLGLPGARKTATGQWSTGARLLEELAETSDHPLPRKILEWRQLSKLKTTYTDALPTYIHKDTGRVHTSFALAATTTGRLSSSEPNLQNIPIRTEEGRKIRTAFVATEGHKLVSADYSQIELRLLAHIADIPQLQAAFADGIDIHALTASEMFGVPVEDMPADIRRRAKAINFGIVYGISAFGLANQLAIPREEAGSYIRRYFERFPGIRDYMDATKRFCRETGYVTTLFGRICHYPEITVSNPSQRAAVERQAINAPIQGSAADIIRRAMARMDAALAHRKLSARMLLQVHDELVFEVPEDEVEDTMPVIRQVMIDAPHPAVQLKVPLQVDSRAAHNWDEAH